jgi:capsular polysaccharide biosynthesis protein
MSMGQHTNTASRAFREPALDDFSFFGFDQKMRQMERQFRQLELRGGEPVVSTVEGAVYVPADQSGLIRRRRGESTDRFSEPSPVEPASELDEDVVYLGWLFNHYGHFLMQSLARAWFLSDVDPTVKVVFHYSGREHKQPARWALRMLDAFGVPPDRILQLDAPTRLRRLHIPEPFFEPRGMAHDHTVRAHEAMARPYQAVAARIAGEAQPSAQPVYLSRRLLPPSQRTIVGEGELEEVLRANGFRIAHTETMSLEEQVRLVNEHTDIFSNAGSAAHNVLFARYGPRLHLLTNGPNFSPDYFLYDTVAAAPTTFINCLSTADRPSYERGYKLTPHLLDLPIIMAYLEQHRFLSNPAPVWPAGHDAELRARYDEIWLYGLLRASRRAELETAIEQEAERLATASWPISLVLARHYTARVTGRAARIARQFAELAAAEPDLTKLAHYRSEVREISPLLLKRGDPETAARLAWVLKHRFDLDPKGAEDSP